MKNLKFEYSTIPTPEGLNDLVTPLRAEASKKALERGLLVDTAVCLVSPPQHPSDPARVSFGVLVGIDVKVSPEGQVWPYGSVLKNVASAGESCYESYHIDLIFPGACYTDAWAFACRLCEEIKQEAGAPSEGADVP